MTLFFDIFRSTVEKDRATLLVKDPRNNLYCGNSADLKATRTYLHLKRKRRLRATKKWTNNHNRLRMPGNAARKRMFEDKQCFCESWACNFRGRSINRERDKPECYRKLRSRSSRHFLPPRPVCRSFVSEPVSFLSGFHFSPPLPHKADLIKCMLSKNDHISHVVFFTAYFFSPSFLKSLDERSPMKMRGLDVVPRQSRGSTQPRRVEEYICIHEQENIPASPRIYASRLFTRQ